jgi:hypothetical protein
MSGFLHRLAVQAIGSRDGTLHSVALLPYSTPPSPVNNDEADRQIAPLGTRGSKRHSVANSGGELNRVPSQNQPHDAIPPSPVNNDEADRQIALLGTRVSKRHPVANSGAELNHVPSQNQPHDSFHAEIDAQGRENEVMPSSPEVLVDQSTTGSTTIDAQGPENEVIPSSPEVLISQSASGFTTKLDLEIAHPSSVKARLRQPGKSIKKTILGESADWDEVVKKHSLLNNSATKYIANEGHSPAFTPSPLLPLKNTTHPSVLNSGAVAQRGESKGSAWQRQVEETTEVHVSIGRIEVTAVHEAPSPKRQAPTAAKTMTLEEYLARRRWEA